MKLKIGILGTRGIPNYYGGFEQIAGYISSGLADKGHEVSVYNSHRHPFQEKTWKNVRIIHCFDPEYLMGSAGQFIYDYNCLRDAANRKFDVLLILGYSSSSVWKNFFPKNCTIIYNMDGLEWKRTKYNRPVQKFLKHAEELAVSHGDFLIADSRGIKEYIKNTYGVQCRYIPYGADMNHLEKPEVLHRHRLSPGNYFMLMARIEPENNIMAILDGFRQSKSSKKMIVVGETGNAYGRYLVKKYASDKRITFTGSIYDQDEIHTLRKNSWLYFHGHSVGGTNPSLLEAMASRALIAAHRNIFNQSILDSDAFYFETAQDVTWLVECVDRAHYEHMLDNNLEKIREHYNWPKIVDQYHEFIGYCYSKKHHEKFVFHRRYAYE